IPSPGDALWLTWLPSRYSGRDSPRSWIQVSIGRSIPPDKKFADKHCRIVWLRGRLAMTQATGALSSAGRLPEEPQTVCRDRPAPQDACRESRKSILARREQDLWGRRARPD